MGVPAFFKWLSKKYPMIVKDAIEVWVKDVDGHEIPINAGAANPNGEYDNLYLGSCYCK